MQRHKRRGNGDRSFQSAGKGDADRSPLWRNNYHEISWPDGGRRLPTDGFFQRGTGKLVKHYGVREAVKNI